MDVNDRPRLLRVLFCRFQCIHSSPDGCCPSRTFGTSWPVTGSVRTSNRTMCSGWTNRLSPSGRCDIQVLARPFPHADVTVSGRNPTSFIHSPHHITDCSQHTCLPGESTFQFLLSVPHPQPLREKAPARQKMKSAQGAAFVYDEPDMTALDGFIPALLLRNPHLMTLIPRYWSREAIGAPLPQVTRRFTTEPRTQLQGFCHWQSHPRSSPTLILLHGLEGSADSHYMRGMTTKAYRAGFNVIRMNQTYLRRQ